MRALRGLRVPQISVRGVRLLEGIGNRGITDAAWALRDSEGAYVTADPMSDPGESFADSDKTRRN